MRAASTNPWFRVNGDATDFWLVQRLSLRMFPRDGAIGIDRLFRLDYMGSAEYEGDMAMLGLRLIRGNRKLVIREHSVERAGRTRTVYFIGGAKTVTRSIASFDVWSAVERPRSKEPTWFENRFAGDDGHHADVVAWWAFRSGVFFTLDAGVAARTLSALLEKPVKR